MKNFDNIFCNKNYEEYLESKYSVREVRYLINFGKKLKKTGININSVNGFSKKEVEDCIFEDKFMQAIRDLFFEDGDMDNFLTGIMFSSSDDWG